MYNNHVLINKNPVYSPGSHEQTFVCSELSIGDYNMDSETKQCTRCHADKAPDEFYRIETRCRICVSELSRLYRQRPEVKERGRSRERSPYRLAQKREYNKRPEVRARRKQYNLIYKQDKERKARRNRRRRELPKRKLTPGQLEHRRIYVNNRNARKRLMPNTFTTEEWQHALNYFCGCCAVCNRQLNDMFGEYRAAIDHWIPLSYKGDDNPGTVANNIVPLCHGSGGCNNRKGSIIA